MLPTNRVVLFAFCALVTIPNATAAKAGDLPAAISPKTNLPLRQSPPGAFFKGKGEQIGEAKKDETLRVIDKKIVPTVFGSEDWLKVQSSTNPAKEGWIFSGPSDSNDSNVTDAAQ